MSAVVFYYRRSEFTTDSKFTIRSVFSTGGKSTAVHLQFVRQYAPHLYRRTFLASKLRRKGNPAVRLPFVPQYASHLYGSTPPICTAALFQNTGGWSHQNVSDRCFADFARVDKAYDDFLLCSCAFWDNGRIRNTESGMKMPSSLSFLDPLSEPPVKVH